MNKLKERPVKLNPYKIYHVIIRLNGGFGITDHASTKVLAEIKRDEMINRFHRKTGVAFIITDKQYGLIKTSWNNEPLELDKPFKFSITTFRGDCKNLIPLTTKQFDERTEF